MEVRRLGAALELQLLTYTTATEMPDWSCICDQCCSFRQCRILNPLSKARDQSYTLMDARQVHNLLSPKGNSPQHSDSFLQLFISTHQFSLLLKCPLPQSRSSWFSSEIILLPLLPDAKLLFFFFLSNAAEKHTSVKHSNNGFSLRVPKMVSHCSMNW